ncbi:SCO2521 family protein [Nocardia sp. NPDC057227]|uniref:SCO2521 family protein n=1 Tax=Nocardia sp. NPDC057227 TaxID=3346056 RepID=UPI00363EE3A1
MPPGTPLIVLGETRTCLLPSAVALDRPAAGEFLGLIPGRSVWWRERPGTLAISPSLAVGVDCLLALRPEPARVVGTVATNLRLAGGRVLQSSASTAVLRAAERRRRPWPHYLHRKGTVEVIDSIPERGVASPMLEDGFLGGTRHGDILDLGSISERLLAGARSHPLLDQRPPVRVGATRLRWTARIGGNTGPSISMSLDDDTTRSVRLVIRDEAGIEDAQRFCEDLAAHDWLLTVLTALLAEADRFGAASRDQLEILSPALVHLTGLWMPGAHTPASMRTLWKELQTDPGFTRQWNILAARIRDGIAVSTLEFLRQRALEFDR